MEILTKTQILENKEFYIKEILNGKIFIYPTDTIYGIGCNATLDKPIQKINQIKNRKNKASLIIAPTIDWIQKHTYITIEQVREITKKFKTQHSIILKLKNKEIISPHTNQNLKTIGIRHPNHWFTELITETNLPFTTTSVNLAGEESATSINKINPEISSQVDYIIEDDNSMTKKASTIIDLTKNNKILR